MKKTIPCLLIIFGMISCIRSIKKTTYVPPIEFNLKVVNHYSESDEFSMRDMTCSLIYEVKNNTGMVIYFNKMNIYEDIKDTAGNLYKEGYFKLLITEENFPKGCSGCCRRYEYDIYPMTKKDTLDNIVKIGTNSLFSDSLRAYGHCLIYDTKDNKEDVPFCFTKKRVYNEKIKFQLLYDNTMQDVRMDTVWKGKMLSNIAVWQ